MARAFNDALSRRGADAPFFLEGIVFSRTQAVLMRGRLVDSPDAFPGVTINKIGERMGSHLTTFASTPPTSC